VASEDLGVKLEKMSIDDLGQCKSITINKDTTIIVEGAGSRKDIEGRIRRLRTEIEETTSDYDREKLQERLAKLVGGVAVIKMGAPTEVEMKEKKARVEDALNATRAAVEEGVVAGGGVALLRCVKALDQMQVVGEEKSGIDILKGALEEPIRQIAENAGYEGSIVMRAVLERENDYGFNAATETYEDLSEAGVIDPAKVVRFALQNAASVAGLMLTTEALIAEKPKKKKGAPHGAVEDEEEMY
jgi:chaperonin GroEL